jgi:PTS system nitrogen regulatory IIA component
VQLKDFIKAEQILFFDQPIKEDVLSQLVDLVAKAGNIKDPLQLKEEVTYREKLMSTGIGLGIAIPHVRFVGVKDPLIAVGVAREGVLDYQAIDDVLVRVIFLVIVSKQQHKEYLQIMAQIVKSMKKEERVAQLASAPDASSVQKLLIGNT